MSKEAGQSADAEPTEQPADELGALDQAVLTYVRALDAVFDDTAKRAREAYERYVDDYRQASTTGDEPRAEEAGCGYVRALRALGSSSEQAYRSALDECLAGLKDALAAFDADALRTDALGRLGRCASHAGVLAGLSRDPFALLVAAGVDPQAVLLSRCG